MKMFTMCLKFSILNFVIETDSSIHQKYRSDYVVDPMSP